MNTRKHSSVRASRSNSSTSGYEVGYRKPPKEYQFKKGQSGNPKGRPKKELNRVEDGIDQILVDVLNTPVTINQGSDAVEVSKIRALFESMVVSAIKGDRSAREELIKLLKGMNISNKGKKQLKGMLITLTSSDNSSKSSKPLLD